MQTRLFGDDDHVYLVENRNTNAVSGVRALRARDGAAEDVPDFAALYQRRLRTVGRQFLLSDTDARANVVLRLYDVQTGKDTWHMSFPPKSLVIRSDDPRLTGAIEPLTGKVRVYDIVSRREVLRTVLDTSSIGPAAWAIGHVLEDGVYLIHDTDQFYLLLNQQANPAMAMWGGVWSNTMGGIRTTSLNGRVYAFNRATGKYRWYADVLDQMLVLDQFNDMPALFCTARSQRLANPKMGPRGGITQAVGVKSIDKRTGKLLFDQDMSNINQFFAVNINPKTATADVVTYNLKIEHYLERPTAKGSLPPRSAQKPGGSGARSTLELKTEVNVVP
jgi:hypothetical protein